MSDCFYQAVHQPRAYQVMAVWSRPPMDLNSWTRRRTSIRFGESDLLTLHAYLDLSGAIASRGCPISRVQMEKETVTVAENADRVQATWPTP